MGILDSLNTEQQAAVKCTEGPLLILAGAGSGKTRVITNRIAYLIEEKGVDPFNILAITFTNKAADEMRSRVDKLLPGIDGAGVWVSTFHSMCVRILGRYIDRIGYRNDFTIYDTDDVKTVIKGIIKRLDIDSKQFPERRIMAVISECKNDLITPEEYESEAADFRERTIAKIYAEYQNVMRMDNALDFDDLLVLTVELFEEAPDVLAYYQNRFRYIHVDEYQDTNQVQFRLVSMLAEKYRNICVVGDDDQSIYKFRGADITNILNFENVFENATTIKLEQNYRSTLPILNCANAVIAHNHGRKEKRLWSERSEGEMVRFETYPDQKAEAAGVIGEIEKNAASGERYGDTAVLYRTNAQSRQFEEVCILRNIPYRIVGGVNFYRRAEIKDILGYLKVIYNNDDDVSLKRVINVPKRGIGDASIEKAERFAYENGISLYEAIKRTDSIPGLGRTASKMKEFSSLMEKLARKADELGSAELVRAVYNDTGYATDLLQLDPDTAETKDENIQELINKAAEYDKKCESEGNHASLREFLEEVALVADVDSIEDDENRVLLMTLHGAKGLEFERVYLCGMEENLFPSAFAVSSTDPDDVEEERRLAYVGITRARTHLKLTAAETRMINGETNFCRVSRFVREIPEWLLNNENGRNTKRTVRRDASSDFGFSSSGSYGRGGEGGRRSGYSSFDGDSYGRERGRGSYGRNPGFGKDVSELFAKKDAPAAAINYGAGDRVLHVKFGEGTVLSIDGDGKDSTVTVEFDGCGVRKFKAALAKLEKKV